MKHIWLATAAILCGLPTAHAETVLAYHGSNDRHGAFRVPGLTHAAAATMKPDPAFTGTISGNVYAQPLFYAPKAGPSLLIVATESNIIYALNAATGAVVWHTQLATPAAHANLPCGDIDPEGVTGAPTIDPATGTLYLDAMTAGTGSGGRQLVYALSATTGAVVSGWPIDLTAALGARDVVFDSTVEGERSATLLFQGRLYVPFGGRSGDCGSYHGSVVELSTGTPGVTGYWQTNALKGGIWSQGGVASSGKSMFVTTGNTSGANSWGEGEAIIRLKPGLAQSSSTHDYYTPGNWKDLDNADADLGGTAAIPLTVANGGKSPSRRMLALGKDGNAYLTREGNLGGIGGQLAILKVSNSSIITGPAVYATQSATSVAFTNGNATGICSGNVVMMLGIAPSGSTPISQLWCATLSGRGAPIVTTTDGSSDPIVWATGAEGDNELHGFDATTGAVLFNGTGTGMTGLRRYGTLIAAAHHLYVAADNKVFAFTFTP